MGGTRFRRSAAAAAAAGLAVGLLAWLGQPSPRLRVPLPGVRPDSRVDIDQADATGPTARWAFLQDTARHTGWAFDHLSGRLHGPHPVPVAVRGHIGDAAGRLYAHAGTGTSVGGFPLTVWRVDLETWHFAPHYEFPDRLSITTTVWDGEPAWLTFAADPLRVEVIDLATGVVRRRIEFPGRAGDLIDNGGPFAGDWDVSPDGHWLAIGEAWNGLRRTTSPGIELWNLSTGRLARRIVYPPPDPECGGCSTIRFTADDRLRFAGVVRHKPGTAVIPLLSACWQVRVPGGACEPDPGGDNPDPPDLFLPDQVDTGSDRRMYRGDVSRDDGTTAFVVTDAAGRPLHPRRPLPDTARPGATLRLKMAASGAGVVAWTGRPNGPSAGWLRAVLTWLGRRPAGNTDQLDWHDWRTGRSWRLGRYPDRVIDVGCQPGGVVVCAHDRAAGRAELEVWADPPDGWPWRPVWPAVAAAGALVGWRVGRPRRDVRPS